VLGAVGKNERCRYTGISGCLDLKVVVVGMISNAVEVAIVESVEVLK